MEKAIKLFATGCILLLMCPFPPYFGPVIMSTGFTLVLCSVFAFKISDNTKFLVVCFILSFVFMMTVPMSARSAAPLGYGFISVYHDFLRITGRPVPDFYY